RTGSPACGRRLTPPGRRLTHAHGRASVRRPGVSAEGTGAGREVVRGIGAGPAYCRKRQGPCSHADRTESRPLVTDRNLNGTREPPICTGVGWSPVQATPAHSWVLCALKNRLRLSLLLWGSGLDGIKGTTLMAGSCRWRAAS